MYDYDLADHTESVEVTFDPSIVSYAGLLRVRRQPPGVFLHAPYASRIFVLTDKQEAEAIAEVDANQKSNPEVATEMWRIAETHHHDPALAFETGQALEAVEAFTRLGVTSSGEFM
ncbi:hypothetical protein M427DRAFT_135492 [Gonapodya prolifera JEL478]|uniref:Uncharacterized protein n=1 Tax=Gonapodya prolifera (strain JEL478) TaxID=1344416 RepID=A0A139AD81_GONPJ|nr:hypothetical protein M427DRAFT_135492 [Gonapodya prolifera JEL478]|eukprot:KXS14786.1 hypothetical protein M427DRAFT_135492 [Gonapodya prolifera JEL478]